MGEPRVPVSTLDDLATLDEAEMLGGYHDGLDGEPEPGDNRSRSYWHGWRNGMTDRTHGMPDRAQMDLARATAARSRGER